jgi:cytochrome c-type biogenesis protein CcmH/NrfF
MPAPSPSPEQVASELADQLMSPYCPGRTIASCPSDQARKLEQDIQEQAEAGRSKAEIEAVLVERFGRERLGTRDDPWMVGGWLIAAVAAALVLVALGRRWRRGAAGQGAAPATSKLATLSPKDLDRVENAVDEAGDF